MPGFVRGTANLKYAGNRVLADALGQGIGHGINTYQANKALDQVLYDPNLRDAPQSEKLGAIQRALSSYGKVGQDLFQNRLAVEQQANVEKEEKKAEKLKKVEMKKGDILRRRLNKEEVSEEEKALFTPQEELAIAKHEQAKELATAKHQQALELQDLKNQGKSPPGGATFQPIPQEVVSKMDEIDNQYPNASPNQKESLYGQAGIPKGYYTSRIETDRRNDEATRKEQISFHDDSKKYAEEIRESAARAHKQQQTITDLMSSVDKIHPISISNIFAKMGTVGEKVSNAFKTAAQGKFEAALPQLIEGWKDVFGVRLTDADLKIIENKLPGIGKTPDANKAIMGIINKYAKFSQLKQEAAEEVLNQKGVKTKHGSLRPLGYENEVEKLYQNKIEKFNSGKFSESPPASDYPKGTKMRDNESGKVMISNGKDWVEA
jgi:hypothetical protein